jgi:hypothetical protein
MGKAEMREVMISSECKLDLSEHRFTSWKSRSLLKRERERNTSDQDDVLNATRKG